jgi:hypothetical protein
MMLEFFTVRTLITSATEVTSTSGLYALSYVGYIQYGGDIHTSRKADERSQMNVFDMRSEGGKLRAEQQKKNMATMEFTELHEDPDGAHESVDIERVNAAVDDDEQDDVADPAQVRDTM